MSRQNDHPLHTLFWPQSVAVIGASEDVGKIRGRLLAFMLANGFRGDILPVNPSHSELCGRPCFPSIDEAVTQLGKPVDVALVAIPATAVLPELKRCAAAGVRHAVIIAAGFAEEGGESAGIQEEITCLARDTGMRICGPNAEGYYNAILNLAATFTPTLAERPEDTPRISCKRVGIVAQSGGVGYALFQQGRRVGLDFSYVMTSGNEADIQLAEFVEYMVQDQETDVIFLYVETIRDTQRFLRAALAARRKGKPIIVIKIGQSASGQRAAASHTAAMAGWNVAYDALFARCGVYQALDLEEALAMCCLLVTGAAPAGKRLAVLSASGGAGAWAGDTIERLGGSVPVLSDELQARVRGHIPSYGAPANPIDVTAQALRTGGMLKIAEMLMESDEIDAVLVVTSLTIKHFFFDRDQLARLANNGRKPFVFYSFSLPTDLAIQSLALAGVAAMTNLPGICSALLKLAEPEPSGYAEDLEPAVLPLPVRTILENSADLLCEFEAKAVLHHFGLTDSREQLVNNVDGAVAVAGDIGFPLVLKIQSPLLPHKSDIGGVRLGIRSEEEIRQAYQELVEIAEIHSDPAQLKGILVQAMAPGGYELIVGSVRDPAVGPLILVGFGGIGVELYRDVVYRMAPVDNAGAMQMVDQLKCSALLKGFRGQAAVDIEPLAELISRVSRIAWELKDEIDELEINPVIVHTDNSGLTLADALMRKRARQLTTPSAGHTSTIAQEVAFDF